MSYDYTVLAGTQGWRNHAKKDRLLELAAQRRLPVVLFAEGGGGRPGDVDMPVIAGLDTRAFELFARLSGLVPLVGIATGFTFAGNAALLGCCDVVIATEDASIGMGGPAMIEGGGLGSVRPEEVGPIDVQWANGVVDVRVADDPAAVDAARAYLSYVVPPLIAPAPDEPAGPPDQALLRDLIPTNRKRVYEVRRVIETLTDDHLELRRGFAPGMVTALARIDGHPFGIVANDPAHLGGAIDSDGADKAARFMQLCDAHGLPILFLADTPGFMVGPAAEATAAVRHVSRMFVCGANLTVPTGTVVLRKGVRPRRTGDGRRQLQGAAVLRRLADRRVRRHGPRGRGAARDASRARGDRRPRRARADLRSARRRGPRAGRRDQHGRPLGDRRRDRPRRHPAVGGPAVRPRRRRPRGPNPRPGRGPASFHRHLVVSAREADPRGPAVQPGPESQPGPPPSPSGCEPPGPRAARRTFAAVGRCPAATVWDPVRGTWSQPAIAGVMAPIRHGTQRRSGTVSFP